MSDQQSIHTEAPASPEFIRVVREIQAGFGVSQNDNVRKGAVGQVLGRGTGSGRLQPKIVLVNIVGLGERVFNTENTEIITKKEYFIGALSGR